jgi:tape measure domain-containing protein
MSTEKAEYEIRLKSDQFQRGLRSIEGNVDNLEGKLKDLGGTIGSVLALNQLKEWGQESIRAAAKMESMQNAIIFASGSAKQGAENLEFLRQISSDLGFNLISTTEGFKTFTGALIGSKFEGDKANDIFRKISYGISSMGLDAESAKGAFLALGQMVSKGTVSAEELRGQLGERLPGAFQIAARAMGVTTSKLGDMLKQGEVITDEFLPKFADEMEKTFAGGVAKASHSIQADLNRLDNKLDEVSNNFGVILSPIIHLLGEETKSATDQFKEQKMEFDRLTADMPRLISEYNSLRDKTNKTAAEQEELKNITQTLAEIVPTAVTAWDNYGNAISLSNVSMKEHIALSKDALAVLNADAIRQTEDELLQARRNVIAIKKELDYSADHGVIEGMDKEQSDATIRWLKGNLEIEQNKMDNLIDKRRTLKGGESPELRHERLMKGIAERDKMFAGLTPKSDDDKKKKSAKGAGVEKVQSGNRNITIHITKLVDGGINFHNTKYAESEAQMVERLKRVLLTVVNDANIVAN